MDVIRYVIGYGLLVLFIMAIGVSAIIDVKNNFRTHYLNYAFFIGIIISLILTTFSIIDNKKSILDSNYNEIVVEDSFYKGGYYYFELEGIDSYVKIPVDELQLQN